MRTTVVSDSGPLITAERLGDGFATLRRLFDRILVPPAVFDEVSFPYAKRGSDFVRAHGLADLVEVSVPAEVLAPDPDIVLEAGEVEALSLAVQESCYLLIEDGLARVQADRLAAAGRIPGFAGLAGAVREGFRAGALAKHEALSLVDRIRAAGRLDQESWRRVRAQIEASAGR
jgi:predicted nucleic acid-binding protein